MREHFVMMAGYASWANGILLDEADALSQDAYAADAGVFFGSMAGTLNHLLVADRIWMHRLTGQGPLPDRLDAVPCPDRASLRRERVAEDARIEAFVAGLDAQALAAPVTYRTIVRPEPVTQTLASALAHVFNHQTHHRGHAHAILTRLGREAPSLDLVVYQRETGIARREPARP